MFRKVDKYILKTFLPMLAMTFLICWFIVLMQFLWRYVDELVGKGLDFWVVLSTIFYAALTLVPLSLPLGILLASLMTFGNMGERLELLALKASGIPLYRIMRPIFITVALLSVGLFVFQNTIMVSAQLKLWTNILSARQTSPELEIPEGAFYNGINQYSVYIKSRNKQTKMLYDVMIYDVSNGVDKTRIIRSDSGFLSMDKSKLFLSFQLYDGISFENLQERISEYDNNPISHARERFKTKEIIIPFDANLKMLDNNALSSLYIAKDLRQLQFAIDSTSLLMDSIRTQTQMVLSSMSEQQRYSPEVPSRVDTTQWAREQRKRLLPEHTKAMPLDLDSLASRLSLTDSINIVDRAIMAINNICYESDNRLYNDQEVYYTYRTSKQEWHRKFTFPVACLVFFFIGVPLGAIIRRGGLGMPVIVAVSFFIFYYVIDTFGLNMSTNETLTPAVGMWLSTFVLLPIGAFLTYKATIDSTSLQGDTYLNLWRKLIGTYAPMRVLEPREGIELEPDYKLLAQRANQMREEVGDYLNTPFFNKSILWVWFNGYRQEGTIATYSEALEQFVEELRGVSNPLILAKAKDLPIIPTQFLPRPLPRSRGMAWGVLFIFPLYLPIHFLMRRRRMQQRLLLSTLNNILADLIGLLETDRYPRMN